MFVLTIAKAEEEVMAVVEEVMAVVMGHRGRYKDEIKQFAINFLIALKVTHSPSPLHPGLPPRHRRG